MLIERRLERWKVGLRDPGGMRGVFEAFAEAEAYLERGGGVVSVEVSAWITESQVAVSRKRMPILAEGGLSDIVISSMASVAEDTSVCWIDSLKIGMRYFRSPPKATTSAAPPPKQATWISGLGLLNPASSALVPSMLRRPLFLMD